MKLFQIILFTGVLFTGAIAWTKEDHEIFDLVSAIEAAEGKGTTFYSWLDVPSTATSAEINKAYRKKSIRLHPDKNPGVKNAHDRFARLGVVASILRNSSARERYDFFYKNGVPKWRGTGYYYSRYRPGLGSALIFLVIVTTGLQYLVQRMNYAKDLARIEKTIRDARTMAWGPKLLQQEGKKKVKVNLGGKGHLDDEGNWVSGKTIDLLVEGPHVYILDPDGSMMQLDSSAANPPSVGNTWVISLVRWAIRQMLSQEKPEMSLDMVEIEGNEEAETTENGADGASDIIKLPVPASKTGGRRRKALRKVIRAKKEDSTAD